MREEGSPYVLRSLQVKSAALSIAGAEPTAHGAVTLAGDAAAAPLVVEAGDRLAAPGADVPLVFCLRPVRGPAAAMGQKVSLMGGKRPCVHLLTSIFRSSGDWATPPFRTQRKRMRSVQCFLHPASTTMKQLCPLTPHRNSRPRSTPRHPRSGCRSPAPSCGHWLACGHRGGCACCKDM